MYLLMFYLLVFIKHLLKVDNQISCLRNEDVPLVEFLYLVFTRMPGESYRRQLGSLLLYLFTYFEC